MFEFIENHFLGVSQNLASRQARRMKLLGAKLRGIFTKLDVFPYRAHLCEKLVNYGLVKPKSTKMASKSACLLYGLIEPQNDIVGIREHVYSRFEIPFNSPIILLSKIKNPPQGRTFDFTKAGYVMTLEPVWRV